MLFRVRESLQDFYKKGGIETINKKMKNKSVLPFRGERNTPKNTRIFYI